MANVSALLDTLNKAELKALQTSLAYRLQEAGKQPTREEAAVFEAVVQATGSGFGMPYGAFLDKVGVGKFGEAVTWLMRYIDDACGPVMRWRERERLIGFMLRALVTMMREREIPCTATSIINCFHMLHDAVDRQFPGYAACGMLDRVVQPRG